MITIINIIKDIYYKIFGYQENKYFKLSEDRIISLFNEFRNNRRYD